MNSPLILSYNDYSRANAEKKEKVKYGGSNLKVYIFLADGFEEIEGLTVVDIMRRAKIDVETISITGQKQINGAHKIIVEADRLFEETDFSDGDMLVLPGGMPGTLNLKEHEGLRNLIGEFDKKKKYLQKYFSRVFHVCLNLDEKILEICGCVCYTMTMTASVYFFISAI